MKFEQTRVAGMLVLSVPLLGAVGWPQGPTGSKEGAEKGNEFGGPTVTLGIEISLPDRAVFHVPVVGDREILGIVPLPTGRFAGILIKSRVRADSVTIEVSALATAKKKLFSGLDQLVFLFSK